MKYHHGDPPYLYAWNPNFTFVTYGTLTDGFFNDEVSTYDRINVKVTF